MRHCRVRHILLGLLAALVVGAGAPAFARDNSPAAIGGVDDIFYNEEPIGNEELDEMRGGFITGNGMVIDFSFSANTLIDGQLINQIVLNTANIAANATSLRRIIQVGEGNAAFNGETDMSALPNILTAVQNNMDNLTIQQLNILDLSIQNMSGFVNRSIVPEIDFQNTIGLSH